MKTVNASVLNHKPSLATAMLKNGDLCLARSAKLADMPLANFIAYISCLGIPVINQTAEEVQEDMSTLEQWLKNATAPFTQLGVKNPPTN